MESGWQLWENFYTIAYLSDPFGARDILLGKSVVLGDFPKKNHFILIFPFDDMMEKFI